MDVRRATEADLETIVALTTAKRRRLAAWSPLWWPQAEGADELHRAWLGYLVTGDGPIARVVVDDGTVVGFAVSVPQGTQWFVDDVAFADGEPGTSWGVELLTSIPERPALTCIPTPDLDSVVRADRAGLEHVSSYWVRTTEPGTIPSDGPVPPRDGPGPRHTFGGPFAPEDDATLSVALGAGVVSGSSPLAAPPIYDTSGTIAIVDRVAGPDLLSLLRAALAASHARRDVIMCVVCASGDTELEGALAATDFVRTVEVHAWLDAARE